jgi:triacylglycerol lipase
MRLRRPRPLGIRTLLLGSLAVLVTGVGAAFAMPVGDSSSAPEPVVPASAMHCAGDAAASARAGRAPVLLIHGTGSTFKDNFSWNWARAFAAEERAYCAVDLPAAGTGDLQTAAEYVVHGIRTLHAAAGAPISMVGHSQGGLIGRWALKYWPDTRDMVDDYVSLAAPNHGTHLFVAQCVTKCPAARWQQRTGSLFLTALNTGPQVWPGIDYTQITTHTDEVVIPNSSSTLPTASNVRNVSVNDFCPIETVEHFGMAYDNAAYALGIDALTHPGPARPSRADKALCGWPFMPAVDPATYSAKAAGALVQSANSMITATQLPAEPALECYAAESCTKD